MSGPINPLQYLKQGLNRIDDCKSDLVELHGNTQEVKNVISLARQLKTALENLPIPK